MIEFLAIQISLGRITIDDVKDELKEAVLAYIEKSRTKTNA